jgi:DNA methylase
MAIHYQDDRITLFHGDVLDVARQLPSGAADCIVCSPPYYALRDYGVEPTCWPETNYTSMAGCSPLTVPAMQCCLGLEPDPAAFIGHLALIFAELRRVLADDGTLWLVLGDSYANDSKWGGSTSGKHVTALHGNTGIGRSRRTTMLPGKSLIGIPWRTAFALQGDGWILRNAITWTKTNATPESVRDRFSSKCETVFLFAKQQRYWFDLDALREPLARPEALSEGIVFGGNSGGRGGEHRSVLQAATRSPSSGNKPANQLRANREIAQCGAPEWPQPRRLLENRR